jgi:putative ABC transport system permease protein
MSPLLQDLRHGLRLLWRTPAFTIVAVGALALGIGANTAIFSVVYTLLLKPLPYRDPDRLAIVWEHNLPRNRKANVATPGNYLHWREMNHSFEDMAGVSITQKLAMTGMGDPEELATQVVNASLFPILGLSAAHGRVFTAEEDRPSRQTVAVISDRLWKRRFGADPAAIGTVMHLAGAPFTVVGVMPPGFTFLDKDVDVWIPIGFSADARNLSGRWLIVVARLKEGVTFDQAQRDMTQVAAERERMAPQMNSGWTADVVPLKQQLTGDVKPALLVMLGAVGFVLLIACANVANLLLARTSARHRELAVRAALGADRFRLIRQLLAESTLLAVAGGAAGVALSAWALSAVRTVAAPRLSIVQLDTVGVNGWVLTFAFLIALASGILFGIVPAFTAAGGTLTTALKEGGRTGTGAHGTRTRQALVVAEMALALVLLVGAGLLVRSFMALMHVDPGFDPSRAITMKVTLPAAKYPTATAIRAFFDRLYARVDALPGVEASGGVSFLPLTGIGSATGFTIEGKEAPAPGQEPVTDVRAISHDYFRAMGIPLLRGRFFDSRENGERLRRVIVSESLASRYFPGEDPIGRRIVLSWNDRGPDEIVGVVGDVRNGMEDAIRPTTYLPPARFAYPFTSIAVRTSGSVSPLAPAFVSAVREIDPEVPVSDIRPMTEVLSISTAQRRLTMMLLGIFAAMALLLAAVGLYGVISYTVTQRTQEIGIRMALGAQRRDVLRMVVGQAMTLTALGVAIGAAGAFLLTRLMATLLFKVEPGDPATFAGVALLLAFVALVASYIPGLRATTVDPVVALRAE